MLDDEQLQMVLRACQYLLTEGGDFNARQRADLSRARWHITDLLNGDAIACYMTIDDVIDIFHRESPEKPRLTQDEARVVLRRARGGMSQFTLGLYLQTLLMEVAATRQAA